MYLPFYGLKAEPFLLTPDHRFFFESNVHSQAMAHLVYGINRGEGFIVITGEVGAGKTTLVKQLCACIDPRRIVAAHVVTTMVSGADLLSLVMGAFGIKDMPSEKGAMLLRLQQFFEQTHRKGRRALLLIDEAQNLPAAALEELRMISNFQIGAHAPVQTFLIAQPQFQEMIADPDLEQLRQRVITSYHLGPMSREEVGRYIPHRLSKVGWRRDPDFEDSFVEAIFQHTGGVPRRINTLASRMLLYGFLEKIHRFTAEDVEKVAADLLLETSRPPALAPQASAATLGSAGDLVIARLDRIEQRLRQQDEHMTSTISAMRELLKLALFDRDRHASAGN
jgi:putative secretion ATPase (PEP-CTERM system associated)